MLEATTRGNVGSSFMRPILRKVVTDPGHDSVVYRSMDRVASRAVASKGRLRSLWIVSRHLGYGRETR